MHPLVKKAIIRLIVIGCGWFLITNPVDAATPSREPYTHQIGQPVGQFFTTLSPHH